MNNLKQRYLAHSADQEFCQLIRTKLKSKCIGSVHSVFNKVINFQTTNGQIYSILQYEIDNGPYSLRINSIDESFSDLNIKVNDAVKFESNYLCINAFNVKMNDLNVWEPNEFKFNEKHLPAFRKNIEVFNETVHSNGSPGGTYYYYFKNNFSSMPLYDASVVEKKLCYRISAFLWCIQNEPEKVGFYIKKIIGFGYGLTPSGDDYLAGFITSLTKASSYKASSCVALIADVLKNKQISTTDISNMMIQASLEGKISERMNDFMECLLLHRCKERLKESILTALSVGSMSGTDFIIGIVDGIKFSLQNGEK